MAHRKHPNPYDLRSTDQPAAAGEVVRPNHRRGSCAAEVNSRRRAIKQREKFGLGHGATQRGARTCAGANPQNVGGGDHAEHHARARCLSGTAAISSSCNWMPRRRKRGRGWNGSHAEVLAARKRYIQLFGTSQIPGARLRDRHQQDTDQPLISWLVRPESNLQPDRYEREHKGRVR
jgi:hypothetical protein